MRWATLVTFALWATWAIEAKGCKKKQFGSESVVCVCDDTYCDTIEPVGVLEDGQVIAYTTSKSGDRLKRTNVVAGKQHAEDVSIYLEPSCEMQEIEGFGGAFTDAAGMNIASLSKGLQQALLNGYFGPDGIEYNIGRVPMASCDFSTRIYSYDDVEGDLELKNFHLAEEDEKFKIPYMEYASDVTNRSIKFFGSPWSAPAWMKTNKNMTGDGTLIGQPGSKYYKSWAQYFAKFVKAYGDRDLPMWAVTMQNEPSTGFLAKYPFQTMGFTADMQKEFVKQDLGRLMYNLGVKVMIMDDNRILLPHWAKEVLSDEEARRYISHVAVHWYADGLVPTQVLQRTHELFPDVKMIATEACEGWHFGQYRGPVLGSWLRAQHYASAIIEDLNNWFTGWVDWNLALDMRGGPNWVKNFVDSPVIVNSKKNKFYRQPMFYAIGHFSKFLTPGSRRVLHKINHNVHGVEVVAFKRPDNLTVLVVHNRSPLQVNAAVYVPHKSAVRFQLPPTSIQSVLWK